MILANWSGALLLHPTIVGGMGGRLLLSLFGGETPKKEAVGKVEKMVFQGLLQDLEAGEKWNNSVDVALFACM